MNIEIINSIKVRAKEEKTLGSGYDYLGDFSSDFACVKKDGLYGYIDKFGKERIKPIYLNASNFSNGLACVQNKETKKYGYIDKQGKIIIPFKYEYAKEFNEGLALVYDRGYFGYINAQGIEEIAIRYEGATIFSEGLACVRGTFFPLRYIDKTGKRVLPYIRKYDEASSFSEGLALVRKKNKYGYINKNLEEVIPCIYEDAMSFNEGLALVCKDGNYGYIDKKGNEVIPLKYLNALSFSSGLACVQDKETKKYGYIDKQGKIIIPFKYDEASSFSEGLASVKLGNNRIYIDKSGRKIIHSKCKEKYVVDFAAIENDSNVKILGYKTNFIINNENRVSIESLTLESHLRKINEVQEIITRNLSTEIQNVSKEFKLKRS